MNSKRIRCIGTCALVLVLPSVACSQVIPKKYRFDKSIKDACDEIQEITEDTLRVLSPEKVASLLPACDEQHFAIFVAQTIPNTSGTSVGKAIKDLTPSRVAQCLKVMTPEQLKEALPEISAARIGQALNIVELPKDMAAKCLDFLAGDPLRLALTEMAGGRVGEILMDANLPVEDVADCLNKMAGNHLQQALSTMSGERIGTILAHNELSVEKLADCISKFSGGKLETALRCNELLGNRIGQALNRRDLPLGEAADCILKIGGGDKLASALQAIDGQRVGAILMDRQLSAEVVSDCLKKVPRRELGNVLVSMAGARIGAALQRRELSPADVALCLSHIPAAELAATFSAMEPQRMAAVMASGAMPIQVVAVCLDKMPERHLVSAYAALAELPIADNIVAIIDDARAKLLLDNTNLLSAPKYKTLGEYEGNPVYYVNGMWTKRNDVVEGADVGAEGEALALAEQLRRPVRLIYNDGSPGSEKDVREAFQDRIWPYKVSAAILGMSDEVFVGDEGKVKLQHNPVTSQVAHLLYHSDDPIDVVGYSQGSLIIKNACFTLQLLGSEKKVEKQVRLVVAGPPYNTKEYEPRPDKYKELVHGDDPFPKFVGLRGGGSGSLVGNRGSSQLV